MTLPRPSLETEARAERHLTRLLLLIIALGTVLIGFALIAYGLVTVHAHVRCEARVTGLTVARNCIALAQWPFWAGGVFILIGALVVQYRDVQRALAVVRENASILPTFGRRATDQATPAPSVAPAAPPTQTTQQPAVPVLPDEKGLG